MILSISGKIGSGKDTTGKIMQILIDCPHFDNNAVKAFLDRKIIKPSFTIEKWGAVLKNIVCLLTNCTREELEDEEFKNKELGEEWTTYAYAEGFSHIYSYKNGTETKTTIMNSVPCSKERYEEELRINWQTAYKKVMTRRLLLQLLGTECGRNIIHPNIWVNALMSEYVDIIYSREELISISEKNGNAVLNNDWSELTTDEIKIRIPTYLLKNKSNWIITDTRFPNEHKAVIDNDGINIRINRTYSKIPVNIPGEELNGITRQDFEDARPKHESETALDNATFDYTIENDGTLDELIDKVKALLVKLNLYK